MLLAALQPIVHCLLRTAVVLPPTVPPLHPPELFLHIPFKAVGWRVEGHDALWTVLAVCSLIRPAAKSEILRRSK